MKVLMLSTADQPQQYSQFLLTGLRQKLGTCEFFSLSKSQQGNVEQFFSSFITLQRFDRIVLEFSQELIYKQNLFLRNLPFLAVLNLNSTYDKKERSFLNRNLNAMPWLRIISNDLNLVDELLSKSIDIAWITPSVNPNTFKPQNKVVSRNRCVVFDPEGKIRPVYEQMVAINDTSINSWDTWEFCDGQDNISIRINPKDIFVYWPSSIEEIPMPMIEAMCCGAAIVCPNFGPAVNSSYQWRNEHNCLFVNTPDTAVETALILLEEYEIRAKLSRHSLENIRRFSSLNAGEELGEALKPEMRRSSEYRKKTRLFGFEI